MEDREQYSTSGGTAQADLDALATELQAWRDIGIDMLEAAALSDESGLRGCMGAIAERLRGQRAQVTIRLETTVQAPAPSITATYAYRPLLEPVPADEKQEEAAATPVKVTQTQAPATRKRHNWSDESREAARQRVMVTNAKRKAAQANGQTAPVVAPAPVQEAPASVPSPSGPAPSIGEDTLHKPSLGTRTEACVQDIRALIPAQGGITAPGESHLARVHNLSLNQVQKLVEEEQRRIAQAATRAAKRAAAAEEQTAEVQG